jgi:hypothetical protein
MVRLPDEVHWLFWETDAGRVDTEAHAEFVMARVLEFGRMSEVRWLLRTYGRERLHAFLREVGHPELTSRTLDFWHAAFAAEDEVWADPASRRNRRVSSGA